MSKDIGTKARARLNEPPPPPLAPLEVTRTFLRSYASDADDMEEIHAEVARMAAANARSIVRALQGIEALLADPPVGGRLAQLLMWDGNQVLTDPSDYGAKAWLRDMAAYMRAVLGDQQPPQPFQPSQPSRPTDARSAPGP